MKYRFIFQLHASFTGRWLHIFDIISKSHLAAVASIAARLQSTDGLNDQHSICLTPVVILPLDITLPLKDASPLDTPYCWTHTAGPGALLLTSVQESTQK